MSRNKPLLAAIVVVILVVVAGVALYARVGGAPARSPTPGVAAPGASAPASSSATSPATATIAPSRSNAAVIPSATGGPPHNDWPTYHGDPARRGFSGDQGSFTSVEPAWQSDPLDGDVYAEPVVARDTVIVATERNVIYGFAARTGQRQWRTQLGPPVDASTLPCGNIRPVSGITGTPVADAGSATVYVVAFEQPAHHELYAIDVRSGSVHFHRAVDPPGADPNVQQERGALALANGNVYVPYGGLLGDCGAYHGWVVGVPAASAGGALLSYQVPTPREAGIWAPSGIAADGSGRLYVATGNGASTGAFDQSNSVLRLAPDLKVEDYWAASDWLSLSRSDTDIGSVGPTLTDNGFVLQGGKDGYLYVLRAGALGKIGGEVAKLKVGGGVYGGFAYADGVAYVPCTDGLAAVRIAAVGTPTALWRGPRVNAGPPIVAGGAVWTTAPGSGTLYALDPATGAARVQRSVGAMQHFTTPAAYGDLILVAAGGRLIALAMR